MEAGKDRKWRMDRKIRVDRVSTINESGEESLPYDHEFPFVRFEEIALATQNFSETCMIGQGGFGKVYKVRHSICYFLLFILNQHDFLVYT
jgi:hypothetical protein